ncbi:MAG: DUF72 domain-containing protein [Bernardetiaceae bacterium]|jgi:uncharacterized protein YecE (DUF72 family)|nr:DUF72 domain-containing protein [Bernardetiaceae bacterium]
MDFGKLPDISGVDFALPPVPSETEAVLRAAPRGGGRVYVGCPVWACKDWVGKLYPPGTQDKDFLRHYGQQLNTIELNATHYRAPDAATVARWQAETPPSFKFCPKLLQDITHRLALQNAQAATQAFCEPLLALGPRLGLVFMQLPPQFGPDQAAVLRQFLRQWPAQVPLAVEFRHPAWFAPAPGGSHLARLAPYLAEGGHRTVVTDVAGRRDVLHLRLTTPHLVLRLVGNGLHPTDYARATDWARLVADWLAQGLQEAYIFVHEPDSVLAPELAVHFIETLNQLAGFQLPPPRLGPAPAQMQLF